MPIPAQVELKTQPITAARFDWGVASDAKDQPTLDAQARQVFLKGNGLPARWAGRAHFVILETSFGLGHNFLATWRAWRQDPQRCQRLHYVSVERRPPTREDLARAHHNTEPPDLAAALRAAWPPLTPNLHCLDFDAGRVQLTLAMGDVALLLPALRLQADAIYLDGFSLQHNAHMGTPRVLKAVARLAAPGATAVAAVTANAEPLLHAGLTSAGFEVQTSPGAAGLREFTVARFAPRFVPRRLPTAAVPSSHAVVVGAGIAGTAVAKALARQGLAVTVLEALPGAAQAASGNPAGIFHGSVNADDGSYARLYRSAALAAAADYGQTAGRVQGLLRVAGAGMDLAALQATVQAQQLPHDYVQAIGAAAASLTAGVAISQACWFYPGGGCLDPAQWVREALAAPGIALRTDRTVHRLERDGEQWRLLDAHGTELARSAIVVLANAAQASRLLRPLGHSAWPLHETRGQVTHWSSARPPPLRLPVAGEGYAVPLSGGLLCGATRQADDTDPQLRHADHLHNLERLRSLCALQAPSDPAAWQGRVAWRLHADDRLPIAGALPSPTLPAATRRDQARLLPRVQGLFILTALGARGLTLAPLLGRLIAAQATGTPWPLEQDLTDAIDPARWMVRAARAQP